MYLGSQSSALTDELHPLQFADATISQRIDIQIPKRQGIADHGAAGKGNYRQQYGAKRYFAERIAATDVTPNNLQSLMTPLARPI